MKVHEIFCSIQGEGFMAGTPMTFIRLYGCNLSCLGCDTPQTDYQALAVDEIVGRVVDEWVCITGGEPCCHSELADLTRALWDRGIKVALETNGSLPLPGWCHWVCVSPKVVWPDVDVLVHANEIKLLVGSGMYDAEVAIERFKGMWLVQGPYRVEPTHVSLQPWWDDNYEANLREAIRLCQKYQVRLSLQMHKYIGVR